MNCPRCGADVTPGQTACPSCDAPLGAPPPEAPPVFGAPASSPSPTFGPPPSGAASMPGAPNSRMAIASMILGLLGFFTCGIGSILGLVLGVMALTQINRSRGRVGGQGIATAGIALSGVGVLTIPVMAAILFPVFAKARERAKETMCLHTARQLAVALQQYSSEHEGLLPPGDSWEDAIAPYLGPGEVRCPDAPEGTSGFFLNPALAGRPLPQDPATADTLVLLSEGGTGRNQTGGPNGVTGRHGAGVVVAFVDGSARYVADEDLHSLSWTEAESRLIRPLRGP